MLKPVPKKDQPKVIVLSVLAAGLVGGAAYQFNSGDPRIAEAAAKAASKSDKGTLAATATPTVSASTRTPSSGSAPVAAGLVSPVGLGGIPLSANMSMTRIVNENGNIYDLGMVGPPTGGKDPFLPKGGATAAMTAAAMPKPPAPPVPTPVPAAAPPDFAAGRLDNLLNKAGITSGIPNSVSRGGGVSIAEVMNDEGGNRNTANGFPAPSGGAAGAVALPPPPPPAVMVTGIVMGIAEPGSPAGSSVAVVRGADGGAAGGSERRFVRVGDSVGNGFVVAQVKPGGIVIKSGSRRITLRLGEKPAVLGAVAAAVPISPVPPAMGKDEPKNTDKNTNDKNTVFAPAASAFGTAPSATSAPSAGSPLGENFRAK